jgi:transposase
MPHPLTRGRGQHGVEPRGDCLGVEVTGDRFQLARRRDSRTRQTGQEIHRLRQVPTEQLFGAHFELVDADDVRHRQLEMDRQVRGEQLTKLVDVPR